ncbi:MAG: enoyl-CoA hydratase/isomerase family protein [Bacteroidota bacterium]
MEWTQIKYNRLDNIAWITLNRPEKLNALTEVMLQEWRQLLTEISKDDDCRVVVVQGEGKSWSAGVDLSMFQKTKVEPGYQMWEDGLEIMRLLENMPQVTIAMLNGYCFTGALEILMAFDLIVAADEAKIGDTHAKWGIPPKWGMTQRLMHQVGMRKAKELSFTAKTISGQEAAAIGLVNQSVPLSQLKETVDTLIGQILQNSAQTIAAVKQLYQFGSLNTLKEGLDFERDYKMELTDKTKELKDFKKVIKN